MPCRQQFWLGELESANRNSCQCRYPSKLHDSAQSFPAGVTEPAGRSPTAPSRDSERASPSAWSLSCTAIASKYQSDLPSGGSRPNDSSSQGIAWADDGTIGDTAAQ